MQIDTTYLLPLATNLMAILIPIIAGYVITYLHKMITTENIQQIQTQIAIKQGLAYDIVNFIEQVYKDLNGQAKFTKAVANFMAVAAAKGINITTDEMQLFIESAVKIMKDAVKAV
jgi:intergrase/recombinase